MLTAEIELYFISLKNADGQPHLLFEDIINSSPLLPGKILHHSHLYFTMEILIWHKEDIQYILNEWISEDAHSKIQGNPHAVQWIVYFSYIPSAMILLTSYP